jgi:hypothetical protein
MGESSLLPPQKKFDFTFDNDDENFDIQKPITSFKRMLGNNKKDLVMDALK